MELVQYKEEEEEEEKDVGIKVIKWHWVQRIQISRWPYIEFFSFIRKLQQGAKFAYLPRGEERFGLTQKKFLQYANT